MSKNLGRKASRNMFSNQIFIERSDNNATSSDSEINTTESNSDCETSATDSNIDDRKTSIKAISQSTSEDSNSNNQISREKRYAEIFFALGSGNLSAVMEKVKKLPLEQRLLLGAMIWKDLKLLELILPWAKFMDLALHSHNLNPKLPPPKKVIEAAVVLMDQGAYLTSQIPAISTKPKDELFKKRRTKTEIWWRKTKISFDIH